MKIVQQHINPLSSGYRHCQTFTLFTKLEIVVINDVLPFIAAWHDAIANLISFGASWSFERLWDSPCNFQRSPRVSIDRFILKIITIKSSKNDQIYTVYCPQHPLEQITLNFYGKLLARFTFYGLAKFIWFPFADLHMRSLAIIIIFICQEETGQQGTKMH